MTPERWQHIERLYHAALERHAAERKALVCDDVDLSQPPTVSQAGRILGTSV